MHAYLEAPHSAFHAVQCTQGITNTYIQPSFQQQQSSRHPSAFCLPMPSQWPLQPALNSWVLSLSRVFQKDNAQ